MHSNSLFSLSTITLFLSLFPQTPQGHQCMSFPESNLNQQCVTDPINGKTADYCGVDLTALAQEDPLETFSAGQVFNVTLRNPNVNILTDDGTVVDQARHGGGHMEFSLSYDEGPPSNFRSIAYYTRSGPDVFDPWPVRIPDDAPCGRATFAWTWFPALSAAPEMYMDCGIVEIECDSSALSIESFNSKYCKMTEGNIPGKFDTLFHNDGTVTRLIGDGSNSNQRGRGPLPEQVRRNVEGEIVLCEGEGVEFDMAAAHQEDDPDGNIMLNTNGEGPVQNGEGGGNAGAGDNEGVENDYVEEPIEGVGEGQTPEDADGSEEVGGSDGRPVSGGTGEEPVNGAPEEPVQGPTREEPVNGAAEEPVQGPTREEPVNGAPEEPVQDDPTEQEPVNDQDPPNSDDGPSTTPSPSPTSSPCPSAGVQIYCSANSTTTFYQCGPAGLYEFQSPAGMACKCTGDFEENGFCIGNYTAA